MPTTINSFDLEAELQGLEESARRQLDALLQKALLDGGSSVPNIRAPGDLLITKPAPFDSVEQDGDVPFFRITALDSEAQPVGHTVVGKAQYRRYRQGEEVTGYFGDLVDSIQDSLRPDLTRGISSIVLDLPGEFSYRLRYRDHGIGTTPADGLKSASGRDVVFSRPLSTTELNAFEITPIGFSALVPKLPAQCHCASFPGASL